MGPNVGMEFGAAISILSYSGHVCVLKWGRLLESGVVLSSMLTIIERVKCRQCDVLK